MRPHGHAPPLANPHENAVVALAGYVPSLKWVLGVASFHMSSQVFVPDTVLPGVSSGRTRQHRLAVKQHHQEAYGPAFARVDAAFQCVLSSGTLH